MRFIVKASTSGAPELGCDSAANFSGDRHSGEGGPRLEGAVAGRLCRGVSLELRRWLRVGFTGVAVDKRASALDGDKASWMAAICSAFPTPGKGWSQTWSARRRDAPVEVERCESPEALRADRVEAADWGRCIGILCLGVAATASGAGCPFGAWRAVALCDLWSCVRGSLVTPSRWRSPAQRGFSQRPYLFTYAPVRWPLGRLGDVSVDALCCFKAVLGVLPKTASELEGPNIDPC